MRKDDPSTRLKGQQERLSIEEKGVFKPTRTWPVWSRVRQLPRRLLEFEERGVLLGVLALGLLFSVVRPMFLTPHNLLMVSRQIAYLGTMCVGMTFVFITGQIDLSVGSIYGLTTMVMALIMRRGVDPWLVLPMGLALGTALGLVNGLLSRALRIESIIITLGTLGVYRGLALVTTNGWPIVTLPKQHPFFTFLGSGMMAGAVPVPGLVWIGVSLVGGIVLAKTVFGRHVYGVGSSELAARVSGISVGRVKVQVLAISGFCCALAAALATGFLKSAVPLAGIGYELDVIAAVIIGGAKLGGGSGSILGSILGIILVGILTNGLLMIGVSAYWIQATSGLLIISAVAVDRLVYGRRREF